MPSLLLTERDLKRLDGACHNYQVVKALIKCHMSEHLLDKAVDKHGVYSEPAVDAQRTWHSAVEKLKAISPSYYRSYFGTQS